MKKLIFFCSLAIILMSGSLYALPTGFQTYTFHSPDHLRFNSGTTLREWSFGDNHYFHFAPENIEPRHSHMHCQPPNTTPSIPEPTTLALFGLGALGLGIYKKFSR